MKKICLGLGCFAGLLAVGGCNVVGVFTALNAITGTIINGSIIAGGIGVLTNLPAISRFIQGLFGGGQ